MPVGKNLASLLKEVLELQAAGGRITYHHGTH